VARAPVVVVGAGPIGMTLALELARYDVPSIVLDSKPHLEPEGSRSIVIARHTIETFLRLGCGDKVLAKGVALARARTYFRDIELFSVEFPQVGEDELPRFLNLQQTYTERFLYDLVEASPLIDARWSSEVTGLEQDREGVTLTLGDGSRLRGAFAVGCDGASSDVRRLLGIEFAGRSFNDRFLIADIRAELSFPNERRFFFDPPHNPGRQVLIHPQPDSEWRIDWQVPSETDPVAERESGRLDRRLRAIISETPYELVWLTAYRFHERIARHFRAGRVFLAGDAAHLFSVFGARGMNSGVEDARNLGWKLALVLSGEAPAALLDTYEAERRPAAYENLRVTSATMRFMAPPTRLHRALRNGILRASLYSRRVRRFVDSGKLAQPAVYGGDGPVGRLVPPTAQLRALERHFAVATLEGGDYLVRPDGYVAARVADGASVDDALAAVLAMRGSR
jgi:2-polyprenyl-6-methoxyphenol hydroxylase-like FAD-dependent oxidoreductase